MIRNEIFLKTLPIRSEERFSSPFIEAFVDNYLHRKLRYYARDIMSELGYENIEQLQNTVKRVSCILKTLEIPIDQNIRAIYRSDENLQMYQDWILSPLAYFLLTINGQSTNPSVGRAQLNLFMRYMRNK
jgi:hypothetical protein